MPPIAILVALADPTRCRLIELLLVGPQPVHVLAAAFKISRPAISRHLRVLKQAGLISEHKFGRENRYRLHAGKLAPVQRWLAAIAPAAKGAAVLVTLDEPVAAAKPKRARVTRPTAVSDMPAPAAAADATAADLVRPKMPAAISQMGFDF